MILGVFFVPLFYVVVQSVTKGIKARRIRIPIEQAS